MPDDKVHVIARIRARGGEDGPVRAVLQELVATAREEEGCRHYELFEEKKAPGTFFTFEAWADQGALDLHLERVQPVLQGVMPRLAEAPELRVLGGSIGGVARTV